MQREVGFSISAVLATWEAVPGERVLGCCPWVVGLDGKKASDGRKREETQQRLGRLGPPRWPMGGVGVKASGGGKGLGHYLPGTVWGDVDDLVFCLFSEAVLLCSPG